jgi:hypothetical protein
MVDSRTDSKQGAALKAETSLNEFSRKVRQSMCGGYQLSTINHQLPAQAVDGVALNYQPSTINLPPNA